MDKFFKFIDRINALAFFAGVVLALGLLLWMISSSLWDSKAKTSVIVPNAAAEKSEILSLTAWEFIPESGIQVLKLQSIGGESSDYASEGRSYKIRNLLFVKSEGGPSNWLFSDQSHFLSRLELVTSADGRTRAIYFESRVQAEKKDGSYGVFLAKPDGSMPVEVLHDTTHVISKRIAGDSIHFVYQQNLAIKESQISLKSFERISDRAIANLIKIP